MGEPGFTKLTPGVQKKIVHAVSTGNVEETAAEYAGISPRTFYRWMQNGKTAEEGSPLWQFRQAILHARMEAEMRHLKIVELAAEGGDWRAAQFWLERRRNDKWGKKENLDVTIRREAERVAKASGLDAAEVVAEAERLMRE